MKKKLLWSLTTAIICGTMFVAPLRAEDAEIEDWFFVWKIAEKNEASLKIQKDSESTIVIIKDGFLMSESVSLTAEQAIKIGEVLKKAGNYRKKWKDSKTDQSDKINAGDYNVFFLYSTKTWLRVTIKANKDFTTTSVQLTYKQAKAFCKKLVNIKKYIAILDKKLKALEEDDDE